MALSQRNFNLQFVSFIKIIKNVDFDFMHKKSRDGVTKRILLHVHGGVYDLIDKLFLNDTPSPDDLINLISISVVYDLDVNGEVLFTWYTYEVEMVEKKKRKRS